MVCEPGLHAVDTAGRHAAQAALAVLRESGDTMDMVMGSMTVGGAIVGTLGGGARLAVHHALNHRTGPDAPHLALLPRMSCLASEDKAMRPAGSPCCECVALVSVC